MDDLENLIPGFASHSAEVLKALNEMAQTGLIEKVGDGYRMMERGRLIVQQLLTAGAFPPADDDTDPVH